MHVLRKLTGCLSSTTCDNDETQQQEENTSSTTSMLSQLSLIQDITIEKPIANKVDNNRNSRDIEQTIMINER
jgi:hypothetical protein